MSTNKTSCVSCMKLLRKGHALNNVIRICLGRKQHKYWSKLPFISCASAEHSLIHFPELFSSCTYRNNECVLLSKFCIIICGQTKMKKFKRNCFRFCFWRLASVYRASIDRGFERCILYKSKTVTLKSQDCFLVHNKKAQNKLSRRSGEEDYK